MRLQSGNSLDNKVVQVTASEDFEPKDIVAYAQLAGIRSAEHIERSNVDTDGESEGIMDSDGNIVLARRGGSTAPDGTINTDTANLYLVKYNYTLDTILATVKISTSNADGPWNLLQNPGTGEYWLTWWDDTVFDDINFARVSSDFSSVSQVVVGKINSGWSDMAVDSNNDVVVVHGNASSNIVISKFNSGGTLVAGPLTIVASTPDDGVSVIEDDNGNYIVVVPNISGSTRAYMVAANLGSVIDSLDYITGLGTSGAFSGIAAFGAGTMFISTLHLDAGSIDQLYASVVTYDGTGFIAATNNTQLTSYSGATSFGDLDVAIYRGRPFIHFTANDFPVSAALATRGQYVIALTKDLSGVEWQSRLNDLTTGFFMAMNLSSTGRFVIGLSQNQQSGPPVGHFGAKAVTNGPEFVRVSPGEVTGGVPLFQALSQSEGGRKALLASDGSTVPIESGSGIVGAPVYVDETGRPSLTTGVLTGGVPRQQIGSLATPTEWNVASIDTIRKRRLSEKFTWVIAKDGTGDFTTFGEAIAASSEGDSFLVRKGDYAEDGDLTLKAGQTFVAEVRGETSIVFRNSSARFFSTPFIGANTTGSISKAAGLGPDDDIVGTGTNFLSSFDAKVYNLDEHLFIRVVNKQYRVKEITTGVNLSLYEAAVQPFSGSSFSLRQYNQINWLGISIYGADFFPQCLADSIIDIPEFIGHNANLNIDECVYTTINIDTFVNNTGDATWSNLYHCDINVSRGIKHNTGSVTFISVNSTHYSKLQFGEIYGKASTATLTGISIVSSATHNEVIINKLSAFGYGCSLSGAFNRFKINEVRHCRNRGIYIVNAPTCAFDIGRVEFCNHSIDGNNDSAIHMQNSDYAQVKIERVVNNCSSGTGITSVAGMTVLSCDFCYIDIGVMTDNANNVASISTNSNAALHISDSNNCYFKLGLLTNNGLGVTGTGPGNGIAQTGTACTNIVIDAGFVDGNGSNGGVDVDTTVGGGISGMVVNGGHYGDLVLSTTSVILGSVRYDSLVGAITTNNGLLY